MITQVSLFEISRKKADEHFKHYYWYTKRVVGVSIKSDINPGIELGTKCILYVYHHPSYLWRQEHGSPPLGSFYKIDTHTEAKTYLKSHSAFKTDDDSQKRKWTMTY